VPRANQVLTAKTGLGGLQMIGLAIWLACVFVVALGEVRGSSAEGAKPPMSKQFHNIQLPFPKPGYPALTQ
jgi:hypothetical protein